MLVWDLTSRAAKRVSPMSGLWKQLSSDAEEAYAAILAMTAMPEQALLFLDRKLTPAREVDAKIAQGLIADLASNNFATREKADQRLREIGQVIESYLQKALARKPGLEETRRIQRLLKAIRKPDCSARQLSRLRAIEVLERIGTAKSKQILSRLAKGAKAAQETRAAQFALKRMQ